MKYEIEKNKHVVDIIHLCIWYLHCALSGSVDENLLVYFVF